MNKNFWDLLDKLVSESEIIIDRPKGKSHPKFKEAIYPVDYGYLKATSSMDGQGIDLLLGSLNEKRIDAILCTLDIMKRDSEIKILIGCTEDEKEKAYAFLNATDFMKCILIERK
jgi:inorganic pyrophosphatase